MARKKQQHDLLFGAMALLALLLAMLLAYVAPPLLLLAWIFTEFRARSRIVLERRALGLLSAEESLGLNKLDRDWAASAENIQELHERGQSAGLQYRGDQLFDARNPLGRELNREIEINREEQAVIERMREDIVLRITGRMDLLAGRYANRAAARMAVFVWAFTYLGLVLFKPGWESFGQAAVASVAGLSAAAFVARTRGRQLRETLVSI